jgi:hypothetical protein
LIVTHDASSRRDRLPRRIKDFLDIDTSMASQSPSLKTWQFNSISRLIRRHDKPSTDSTLENTLKLLQVLAIILSGGWVLRDYVEFKRVNDELTLKQQKLAYDLSTQDRLDAVIDSKIVRLHRFGDGTFLHRYYVSLTLKNITSIPVYVPAIVAQSFIGTLQNEPKLNEALYVNLPGDDAVPGKISWTPEGVYSHSRQRKSPEDDGIEIPDSIRLAADFGGGIRPGESTSIGLTFLIRSRPNAVAAAVIRYWDRADDDSDEPKEADRQRSKSTVHIHTNTELLWEAEDSPALKREVSVVKDSD